MKSEKLTGNLRKKYEKDLQRMTKLTRSQKRETGEESKLPLACVDGHRSGEPLTGDDGHTSREPLTGDDGHASREPLTGDDGHRSGELLTGDDGHRSGELLTGDDGHRSGELLTCDDGHRSGELLTGDDGHRERLKGTKQRVNTLGETSDWECFRVSPTFWSADEYSEDDDDDNDPDFSLNSSDDDDCMSDVYEEVVISDNSTPDSLGTCKEQKNAPVNNGKLTKSRKKPKDHDHDPPEEDLIIRDRKHPGIFIRKVLHSDNSSKRVFNNYHCCFVCGELKSNIRKHILVHNNDNFEVKELVRLKSSCDSREEATNLQTFLINKGDHEHNMTVSEKKAGELIISRRQDPFSYEKYGPCPLCFEWLKIDVSSTKHQEKCVRQHKDNKLTKREAKMKSLVITGNVCTKASQRLLSEVYPIMTNDEVTGTAQADPLIVGLGNFWLRQNIGNKKKRKNYVSSKMRGAARLLLNANAKGTNSYTMNDILTPNQFDLVVHAALQCGNVNEDDDEYLEHPSAALKIKYDICRMVNIKHGLAIREGQSNMKQDCSDFIFLLKSEWTNKVSSVAHKLLRERRMHKISMSVHPEDLQKMASFLKDKFESLDLCVEKTTPASFRDVAQYALARLLTYNKRRSGELEQMLIASYESRSTGMDKADEALMGELTKTEQVLLGSQEIIQIQGKAGHIVPVLVPPDASKALKYLVNKEARKNAGVKGKNEYVFGNTGSGSHRAYDALKRVCTDANVTCPEIITSVNLRKYFATMTQVIGMKDHEVRHLCKHLGHTLDVHERHYRAASGYIERMNIAKLMLIQDFNVAGKFKGQPLEEISVDEILRESEESSNPAMIVSDSEESSVDDDHEEVMAVCKKPSKVVRVKWMKEEEQEIRKYFSLYFEGKIKKTCPSREHCQRAIADSKRKNGALQARHWETLKKKVANMLKKMPKKSSNL